MKRRNVKLIIPYLIIAVLSAIIFTKSFGSGDELWNYNFARNIANGLVPYRDFNMVQTPLSAYIPAAFMAIFGKGLFVHRIVGYLLLFSMIATCYHLCKKVTESSFIGFIAALFVFCVCLPYYIYNYNYLSAFIILIILELEIENNHDSTGRNICLGLLAGILLLIKQNTGVMLLLANVVVCLFNIIKYKKNVKKQLCRIIASIIPLIVFLVYMFEVRALGDFVEYAVLGINTFSHRSTPIELVADAPIFAVFILFIILAYISIAIKIRKEGISPLQLSGVLFGSAWLMITYPLFDAFHLVCVYIPLTPVFLMFVKKRNYKLTEKCVCVFVVLMISFLSVFTFLPTGDEYILSTLNNYENVLMPRTVNENIKIIDNYIEEKIREGYKVRITDDSAVAYKIPIELYEKNWDMLLVGNIGTNSVEDLLESSDKCLYLVYKYTDDLGSQDHFQLIEYIKQSYTKVGEVLFFDVYEEQK